MELTLTEESPAGNVAHQLAAAGLVLRPKRKRGGQSRPHNNVRSHSFMRHWVALVRLRFPLRANRPSDRAAMTTWLHKEMTARGIRPAHQEAAIAVVVEMALLPSVAELAAKEMADVARPRTNGQRLIWDLRRSIRRFILGDSSAGGLECPYGNPDDYEQFE